jgi:hypothetical protein
MLNVNIKIDDQITKMTKRIERELKAYPQQAEDKYVELTPIKTGNARSRTSLRGKDKIVADYPYAHRLDEGYSKQAPKGMSEPFLNWVQKQIKHILRR